MKTPFLLPVITVALLLGGPPAPSWAQAPVTPPGGAEATPAASGDAEPEVAPDSPRASLERFLELGRDGDFEKASRFLALPQSGDPRGPLLAERLKVVLDKHVWFDLEKISPSSKGNLDDGLSPSVERVAEVPIGDDRVQPVYMVRRGSEEEGRYWAFSPNTVRRIDGWYDALPDRWIREALIAAGLHALLLEGPFGLLWWQWLALPLLAIGAWLLGRLLGGVTRAILGRVSARTEASWDDRLLERVGPQLTFAWGLVVFGSALPSLGLTAQAQGIFHAFLTAGAVFVIFWALWRSVDVVQEVLLSSSWAASPSARNLLQISGNMTKGVIAGAGALAILSAFGYPVTTLLGALGIGGLAFAFGAQKTVENLFGSISLAVDQPFRVGDFVKVEDFTGTVEDVGLRSTRFRTLDRTVISIPNGALADQRLETFAARDRMRLATTLGLEYSTTHSQMLQVIDGVERVLREHPRIWPDAMVVKFKEFGASSLDIEVMAWFQVPTWADFQHCRQEVLLSFMKVVEDAGTGFAFPTRTLHVFNETSPSPPPPKEEAPPPSEPLPSEREGVKAGDLPVADGE